LLKYLLIYKYAQNEDFLLSSSHFIKFIQKKADNWKDNDYKSMSTLKTDKSRNKSHLKNHDFILHSGVKTSTKVKSVSLYF